MCRVQIPERGEVISPEPWELARAYEGCPFLHMGRTAKGMDCVGLVALVLRAMGREVLDSPYYGREPARNNNSFQLRDYLIQNLGEPADRPYQVNDVVTMRMRKRFAPHHVAIIAPHPHGLALIHTYGEIKKVVYQRIDTARHAQIVEAWSLNVHS